MRVQLPLALLLASTTVACVDDATMPENDEVISALELDNGGFDTTDEAPLFAADTMFQDAAIESDALAPDPMEADAEMRTMEDAPDADVRDVAVLWGRIPADPTATVVRDWSGELRLSRGGMYTRRRIAFEDLGDRLLPRLTRDAIRFESRTRPAADGLVLRVADPTRGSVDPLRLRYAAANGDVRDIDLSRLDDGPVVEDMGDGNRMIVIAHRRNDTCAHGFIRGRWHKFAPNASTYLGVVANSQGEVVGHIRGIAGQRRSGESVMFGKFINREGQFVGILKGHYENGEFKARWLDRDGDHGYLHGLYFEGPTPRAGGLLGRWAETSCGPTPAH
jgi:hypothetical protein